MPRRSTAECGTATKYRNGCRCPRCKAANTARLARYRATNPKAKAQLATVVPMKSNPQAKPKGDGINEQAVRSEFGALGDRVDDIDLANAVTLAKILDDPAQSPLHVRAIHELQELRNRCRGERKRKMRQTRLATVQAMTSSTRKAQ